jgi:hypothetical protein
MRIPYLKAAYLEQTDEEYAGIIALKLADDLLEEYAGV